VQSEIVPPFYVADSESESDWESGGTESSVNYESPSRFFRSRGQDTPNPIIMKALGFQELWLMEPGCASIIISWAMAGYRGKTKLVQY
jgi:hypothetical protein